MRISDWSSDVCSSDLRDNQPVERPVTQSGVSGAMIDKGNHRHFMQQEIFEQPVVVAQTLQSYLRPLENQVALHDMDFALANIRRLIIAIVRASCGERECSYG